MKKMVRARAHPRPAFTLVELLVITSIIALLIAMLLPTLRNAREQSRRVVCMSHLRGLAGAWELYTIEFHSPPQLAERGVDLNWRCVPRPDGGCEWQPVHIAGFGPEFFDTILATNDEDQVWLAAIHARHPMFQVSNPPPADPLPGYWWNWGLIWKSGFVRNPRVFFCPSVRDPDFAWNTPLNPWPPSVETMWRPDHPWQLNHTQASYERRAALTGLLWDRVPFRTSLAHDLAAPNIDQIAHKSGSNVAYRDGHVEFLRSGVFGDWWEPGDSWTNRSTRRKFLAFSYWADRGGGAWDTDHDDHDD